MSDSSPKGGGLSRELRELQFQIEETNSELIARQKELAEIREERLQVKIEEASRSLASKQKLLLDLKNQGRSRNVDSANGHDKLRKDVSASSHVPVGYSYDPSYDLLAEHEKALKSGGFHVGDLQMDPGVESGLMDGMGASKNESSFMVQWLLKAGISAQSIDLLLENECSSMEVLSLLTESDFNDIGLSVGQKRLLQKVVAVRSADASGIPGRTDSSSSKDTGQLASNFYLGMGVRGAQKPYLDICDFVSVRSPV